MGDITVEVWDTAGNKRQLVELPDDAPVNRIVAVLVDRMSLPRHAPDGQLMSYKFHHKASGRQLLDDQSLREAGVSDGDVLRMQPEITAGCLHRLEPGNVYENSRNGGVREVEAAAEPARRELHPPFSYTF